MRGSVSYQVQQIFRQSGVNSIGESKHRAKGVARSVLRDLNKSASWHNIGKEIGIHSYRTADAYRDVWRQCFSFAKKAFGIKDIEKLEGQYVQFYLEQKIQDGVAKSTFDQYASALEKLEVALRLYSLKSEKENEYEFTPFIEKARNNTENLQRFHGSRAYSSPDSIISHLKKSNNRLAAKMQWESGGRIYEISLIREAQLRGVQIDPVSGNKKGVVFVSGKGGKVRDLRMKVETYNTLEKEISKNGLFSIDKTRYQSDIRQASSAAGEQENGSHGFRWSWAQKRFAEMQQSGFTYEQSLAAVSAEMGHVRSDITEHYLR